MQTITGLYDSYDDARDAVKALEDAGVPSDHISIISNKDGKEDIEGQGNNAAEGAGTGAGIGAVAGGAGGLLTGLGIMAIPGVGPVVAAGWLAATAVGALAGTVAGGAVDGIVGAMIESGVKQEDAQEHAYRFCRGTTFALYRSIVALARGRRGTISGENRRPKAIAKGSENGDHYQAGDIRGDFSKNQSPKNRVLRTPRTSHR